MKILMVCLGNICRSPMAEGILKSKLQAAHLNWMVDSAGTNGFHVGERPHHLSQKVAKLHHIDISNQVSRQFVKADFDRYDRIYAMAEDVIDEMKEIGTNKFETGKVALLMEEAYPGKKMDVPDPWYGGEAGYHEVFSMISLACDAMIKNIIQ